MKKLHYLLILGLFYNHHTYTENDTPENKNNSLQENTSLPNKSYFNFDVTQISQGFWYLTSYISLPKYSATNTPHNFEKPNFENIESLITELHKKLSDPTMSFADFQNFSAQINDLEIGLDEFKKQALRTVDTEIDKIETQYKKNIDQITTYIKKQQESSGSEFLKMDKDTQDSWKTYHENQMIKLNKELQTTLESLKNKHENSLKELEKETKNIVAMHARHNNEHTSLQDLLKKRYEQTLKDTESAYTLHVEDLARKHTSSFFENQRNLPYQETHETTPGYFSGSSYKFEGNSSFFQCTNCLTAQSLIKDEFVKNNQASQASKEFIPFVAHEMKDIPSGLQHKVGNYQCTKNGSDLRCKKIQDELEKSTL